MTKQSRVQEGTQQHRREWTPASLKWKEHGLCGSGQRQCVRKHDEEESRVGREKRLDIRALGGTPGRLGPSNASRGIERERARTAMPSDGKGLGCLNKHRSTTTSSQVGEGWRTQDW